MLYCGDCLEVLPTLPEGCVDAVVTDPPYGNNYSTGHRSGVVRSETRISGDLITKPLLNDVAAELEPLLNDVAAELEPLLNDVAAVYWFAAPDRLDMVLPILRRWQVVNVLAWDKGNCTAGDLEASWGKQWEACVFARNAREPLLGRRDRDVLRVSRLSGTKYQHPTQKPHELMEKIIAKHGAPLVLDPFMGSGTTGVAAVRLERQFIGVELSPEYFEIAKERIEGELNRFPLFETEAASAT